MKYNYTFDIAAIVLYVVIIALYLHRPHVKDKMHKIYIWLFTCATLTPVFDIVSAITVNNRGHSAIVITSSALYYLALQGMTFFFLMYITYQLEQYRPITHFRRHLLASPIVVMVVLILTNDLTGLIFKYSRANGYERGVLHFLCYVVALGYFIWAISYLTVHKNAYNKHFLYTVYNLSVVNSLSIFFQIVFPYTIIISYGFAVSMVLLYLTAHTKNASLDKDSGMLNREYYLDTGTKMIYSEVPFYTILVQIADFESTEKLYGEEFTGIMIKSIGAKLCSHVEIGEAFQTSKNTFAFIVTNAEKAMALETEFKLALNGEWTILERKLTVPYIITTVSFPEKIHSKDEFESFTNAFETTKSTKSGILLCDEFHFKDSIRESKIINAIKVGLKENNFEVYYQPVCTAKDKNFMTAEALVRLNDPELGYISPSEFIPIAEQNGLMISLGNYILEEVCKFVSTHNMEELGLSYIEVNLSVVQCMQRDFVEIIHETLERYGIDEKYICFEITETASNYAPEVFSTNLSMLVNDGHELALDDFGTGYGNLQRMVTTNFAIVKFDLEMTQQACSTPQLQSAFSKMVALFHSLKLRIVAEGVETEEQYNFLTGAGVDYIQGFYFSKAIPQDEFIAFLKDRKK